MRELIFGSRSGRLTEHFQWLRSATTLSQLADAAGSIHDRGTVFDLAFPHTVP